MAYPSHMKVTEERETERALPEFFLFGASLTEWSFSEDTQGFGWFLQNAYRDKANIINEGQAGYTAPRLISDFNRIIERATAPGAAPTLLFTIFVGANDACFLAEESYVKFEATMRNFVETILTQDNMTETKIVLITPPPIALRHQKHAEGLTEEEAEEERSRQREGIMYRTYASKKRYAEGVMQIAADYAETGRVIGLNFYKDLIDEILAEAGQSYDENLPPGSGLVGSLKIGSGWFTDGLHLDRKGYNVLSKALFGAMTQKWPELTPDRL